MSKVVYDEILGKLRTAEVGGGTGGESYVAGEGIAINGNTISATGGGDVTEAEFKDLSDGTQSVSKDVQETRHIAQVHLQPVSGTPLTILHMSDLHADADALNRIVADATALGTLVDDMICTGDMVYSDDGAISSWWNPKVMTCIGNHESRISISQGYNSVTTANLAAHYIEPFESQWGSNMHHTAGTSYYYKDYPTQKIRLIVIDCMMYYGNKKPTEAAAQTSWVTSLLADAVTNSYHVLIAAHGANANASSVYSNFTRYDQWTHPNYADESAIPESIVSAVASSISSGLNFIGYIVGHDHQDDIWDATGDQTQFIFNVTCACTTPASAWQISDQYRDTSGSLDAYNLVSIDTKHSIVKLVRGGGANIDLMGRPRETISFDYGNHVIVDTSRPKTGFRTDYKDGFVNVDRYIPTVNVTGQTITMQAGYAYKATSVSTITLNVESMPSDSYGLESVLDITLYGGTVSAGEGVQISDTFSANTRSICSVHFIDGLAVVNVLSVISVTPTDTYIVTIASGTSDGSLNYGLVTSTKEDVYFSSDLNGQVISTGSATLNGTKNIVGNGAALTLLNGGLKAVSQTASISSLAMSGASGYTQLITSGGSTTVTDVLISGNSYSNAPVGCAGYVQNNGAATITGTTFSNNVVSGGSTGGGAAFIRYGNDSGTASFDNCLFVSNSHTHFGGAAKFHLDNSGDIHFSSCTFSGNSAFTGGALYFQNSGGTAYIEDCTFVDNSVTNLGADIYAITYAHVVVSNCNLPNSSSKGALVATANGSVTIAGNIIGSCVADNGGKIAILGSNSIKTISSFSSNGSAVISSGASITLEDKITVGASRITVLTGGCVVNGATIAAGTYTQIVSSGGSAVAS